MRTSQFRKQADAKGWNPTPFRAVAAATVARCLVAAQGPPSDLVALQIIVSPTEAEAAAVRDQVARGGDFAAIARDKSVDPTARDGGYLGKMSIASLRPELREALAGVAAGQMTAVVRIPTGFAIVRVVPGTEATSPVDDNPMRTLAASATGAVRDAIPVAGLIEADTIFRASATGEKWDQTSRRSAASGPSRCKVLDVSRRCSACGIVSDSASATPSEV